MNIQQKKTEANTLYSKAIEALEKYEEPNIICNLLLDAATILVEIGKASPMDKSKCDRKASALLNIAKKLRATGLHSIAYYDLTGRILNTAKPPKKLDAKVIKSMLEEKKGDLDEEHVPSDYQCY